MSSFATLVSIFTEPGKAMEAVRERSMILLPLFLLVAGNAGLMFGYYQTVDFAWLQDYLLNADPNLTGAAREQARAFMTANVLTGGAVIGAIVVIPVILLLTAVYYLLAAKVIGSDIGFGKWFAFATWSSVPSLLLLPAGIVQILLSSNGQLAPEALNPLSLNMLFGPLPSTSPWAALLNAINLTQLWGLVVATAGLQRWTGKSTAASALIATLPMLVIFGIWALVAALKAGA
jgi:hypothetical protein